MKASEVRSYLLEKGCTESLFAVGARGGASDAYCLVNDGRNWIVFYTERGCDSPPIFSSPSETEACDFFVRHMLAQEHWHLVGWFVRESAAIAFATKVAVLGAKPVRNDIPHFSKQNDPRYRVFVKGEDILAVRKAFATLPIKDEDRDIG